MDTNLRQIFPFVWFYLWLSYTVKVYLKISSISVCVHPCPTSVTMIPFGKRTKGFLFFRNINMDREVKIRQIGRLPGIAFPGNRLKQEAPIVRNYPVDRQQSNIFTIHSSMTVEPVQPVYIPLSTLHKSHKPLSSPEPAHPLSDAG